MPHWLQIDYPIAHRTFFSQNKHTCCKPKKMGTCARWEMWIIQGVYISACSQKPSKIERILQHLWLPFDDVKKWSRETLLLNKNSHIWSITYMLDPISMLPANILLLEKYKRQEPLLLDTEIKYDDNIWLCTTRTKIAQQYYLTPFCCLECAMVVCVTQIYRWPTEWLLHYKPKLSVGHILIWRNRIIIILMRWLSSLGTSHLKFRGKWDVPLDKAHDTPIMMDYFGTTNVVMEIGIVNRGKESNMMGTRGI